MISNTKPIQISWALKTSPSVGRGRRPAAGRGLSEGGGVNFSSENLSEGRGEPSPRPPAGGSSPELRRRPRRHYEALTHTINWLEIKTGSRATSSLKTTGGAWPLKTTHGVAPIDWKSVRQLSKPENTEFKALLCISCPPAAHAPRQPHLLENFKQAGLDEVKREPMVLGRRPCEAQDPTHHRARSGSRPSIHQET